MGARVDLEVAFEVLRKLGKDVEEDECVPFASGEDLEREVEVRTCKLDVSETRSLTVFHSLSSSGIASLTFHRFMTSPTRILASSRI